MVKPAEPRGDQPAERGTGEVHRGSGDTGGWRAIAGRPGVQLLVCGLLLALLFPARSSGAIGLMVIGGALGIGVALLWPHAPGYLRKPPSDITAAMVITIVVAAGLTTFWDAMTVAPDWQMGDWGPQHAVLANIMPSLPGFDVPVWNHALSTGDAPLELYPSLTYFVVGHLALVLGLENDLPLALMIVAVVVHVTIAVMTAVIAMRIAPRPVALLVGLIALVDSGAIAHGGTVGLFKWALLHSATSLAFATIAAVGVLAALRRPRLAASITIWIAVALATATHPAGLIAAASMCVALAAVALLAADVPPRRALVAIGHVALGAALGSVVWMPLAERILAYGQHFPNALRSPGRLLEDLLAAPSPVTSYAMLGYAGYFGILAGLWSRRATVVFVSAAALVLLIGLCDAAYLAFDLAPGQGVARLGTERLAQLARPFVAAAGAYGIAVFITSARRGWIGASTRQRLIAAALIGIMCGAVVRVAPGVWWNGVQRASNDARTIAPDPLGRQMLTAWAREHVAEIKPDAWARAVFEQDTHEQMHLTAETGLPTFHDQWLPDLLLRERIENLGDDSLRRFNVRWAIGVDKSPTLGDPATEITLGSYHIRELTTWDGKFARIEKGSGEVKVLRLDDRAVEIEVTGTTEPVLVALGTGYYPRWRARHASGADQPVYALPSIPDGKLHIVSAWVAPGRTTFTVDGPLPSDGKGRVFSMLAALCAIAGVVVWTLRRPRRRVLRLLARGRQRLPRLLHLAAQIGIPVLCLVLLVRGCVEDRGVTKSLELGTGVRATATVDARVGEGAWESCGYSRLEATYYCDGLVVATDGMAATLNDAAPSWGFNTPAIIVTPDESNAEVRIRLHARLSGTYWTAVNDGSATLEVEGDQQRVVTRSILVYADEGERDIEIRSKLPSASNWSFTFVHEDTLNPPRPHLAPPPLAAPPAIRAIR
ncbi:MAG: hypothetical protein JWP01_2334 [Myxococcales bacterium]|nr:hypothetical protein [Myxococcales bacterium]